MIESLVKRMVPQLQNYLVFQLEGQVDGKNFYHVSGINGKIIIKGDCLVSQALGLYEYLKRVCKVNLSWNGNRNIFLKEIICEFDSITQIVEQKYRVYMNYCTLAYSMNGWDWERWEKEIDFMALNGINMPLSVIGTEAVWYYALLDIGFSEKEALNYISAPTFFPWQLMTNIEGYQPPQNKKLIDERLDLGKKILNRYIEYGMFPIQQGFSGHVPMAMINKFPQAKFQVKRGWCDFPPTAQLDPLDPLFIKFGNIFLEKQKELLGAYHFYACDPFHENAPPKNSIFYLRKVGKAIDYLYKNFDEQSTWVMQSWSLRKAIVKAVPKNRLLILDLDGAKSKKTAYFWKYPMVCGFLHNFGGKNSLHGNLRQVASNRYLQFKQKKANILGSGLFMEGIEQNPVYYDLLFDILTKSRSFNLDLWLAEYVERRYGEKNTNAQNVWNILLNSCYLNIKTEMESCSMIGVRPDILPKCACNDKVEQLYDNRMLISAVRLLYSQYAKLGKSDGYQFDLCDFTRQALSNLLVENQMLLKEAYDNKNIDIVKAIAEKQLQIMSDIDSLLSHRSELTIAKWVCDAQSIATDEQEKVYYTKCAKLLVTIWGDIDRDSTLFDYSWREWNGLIKEYYIPRWEKFYKYLFDCMENGQEVEKPSSEFFNRPRMYSTKFRCELADWEKNWVNEYVEYPYPIDSDVCNTVKILIEKYFSKSSD